MNDKVTDLREERGGFRVTVNSGEAFHLTPAEYRAFPLKPAQTFDWKAYREALLVHQYPEALNRAVALLAVRARSCREVERKLTDRGYLADTVEMVLYKLEKENLLDDEAFAGEWVKARASRGLGKARLMQELRLKGVADSIAQAALATLEPDEQDGQAVLQAAKLRKRYAGLPPREAAQKATAALLRRGYSYAEASRALRAAEQESEE
ncbi:MAG TPA: regulatory protein RecX [Candidatus Limiplasma sp.]|nr:regulatory protein RecX [Candidatus Limiplasma sp.]HPS81647.1 regulatory protein RecX [Candidatus Limiplasma sp.]